MEGRLTGRNSSDGSAYEVVQYDRVLKSIPIEEARQDQKLAAAIKRNRWEAVS